MVALTIPGILIMMASYMAFRYRMEFYPLLEFGAFVGFWHLLSREPARWRGAFIGAAIAAVVVAQISWAVYLISPFASAEEKMDGMGWVEFYHLSLRRWSWQSAPIVSPEPGADRPLLY
jgi:hypothetical protein